MSPIRSPIARRSLLRGAGGIAIGLPWLEAMLPARPAGAASLAPKRFGVYFTPNGTVKQHWTPTGTETEFTLGRILAPLESHKKSLVIVDGLLLNGPGGAGHMRGMGHLLTGTPLGKGSFDEGGTRGIGWASGISVDQEIANSVGQRTKFRSLELGVMVQETDAKGRMVYLGADRPVAPDQSPANVFRRVFSDLTAPGASATVDVMRLREQRKTVLDAVLAEYRRLRLRVGIDDGRKLDAHAQAIREIERRVQSADTPVGAGCGKPAVGQATSFPDITKVQIDLMVMALACDLTRVATLQLAEGLSDQRYPWVGVPDEHHELTHTPLGNTASWEKVTKINEWFGGQFKYLLDRLESVKEGDRTLLDNSLFYWGSDVADGYSHSHSRRPVVLAGGAAGGLRTGRYLRTTGLYNNLLVSLCNLFGVSATTFGHAEWCSGSLQGL